LVALETDKGHAPDVPFAIESKSTYSAGSAGTNRGERLAFDDGRNTRAAKSSISTKMMLLADGYDTPALAFLVMERPSHVWLAILLALKGVRAWLSARLATAKLSM
jgi:hypothetical protein